MLASAAPRVEACPEPSYGPIGESIFRIRMSHQQLAPALAGETSRGHARTCEEMVAWTVQCPEYSTPLSRRSLALLVSERARATLPPPQALRRTRRHPMSTSFLNQPPRGRSNRPLSDNGRLEDLCHDSATHLIKWESDSWVTHIVGSYVWKGMAGKPDIDKHSTSVVWRSHKSIR